MAATATETSGPMSVTTDMMGCMAPVTTAPLVGRDAELDDLTVQLGIVASDEARAGGGSSRRAVLLAGDAGVGKTRLLTALRDRALDLGWQVVAGHCLDFADSALPYLPFSEILGRLQASSPDLVASVAAHHPALHRLAPGRRMMDEAAPGSADGPNTDRSSLFDAVHAIFEAFAEQQPLVVVVEDLHWADQSTRDLLSFLFTRPFSQPVALVASYRSDDLHRKHPLRAKLAEWSRLQTVHRMSLDPLAAPEVRRLVECIGEGTGAHLSDDEVAMVVERAEGNAFFVEELVGAAVTTHDHTDRSGQRWVPADLAEVLLVRLDRLDETARRVVRAASAAGRRVTHELLAVATELDDSSLDEALRAAVERNILVASDHHYAFRHALLGEAVYDDLLPGERVRLHGRFAAAIADGRARGTAAELARHATLAHDDETALKASVQAGHEAAQVGGPDEAAQHFERALRLLSGLGAAGEAIVDRTRLAVDTADALSSSGHPERAAALLAEQLAVLPADAAPESRGLMLAARAVALTAFETEEDPPAISEEAVRITPETDRLARARVLSAHAHVLAMFWRHQEAQQAGLDALALADQLNRSDIAAEVITTLSGLRLGATKERLREALGEAIDRTVETGAVHAELRGRYLLARSYQDWGELDQAERWFRSSVERATAAGIEWAPYAAGARFHLIWVLMTRGDWDDVLKLADLSGTHAPPLARANLAGLAAAVRVARGEDLADELRELRPMWRLDGALAVHAAGQEIRLAVGDADVSRALAAYRRVVEVLTPIWHPWFDGRVRMATLVLEAVAAAMPATPSGDRAALLALADTLHDDGHTVVDRYADLSKSWGPEGRAWLASLDAELLRVRWLAGADDAPSVESLVAGWHEVVALFEAFGDTYELARARVVLASVLRAAGDLAGAREVADLAREAARRLGATPLVDQLRALGSAPARHEAGSDVLTPREAEILQLVAAGRSNGEIGKQLFISTKTVSVHVSNILGKLGASGRTEAAAIARRRGLVD
ncbi:AAA family ATPase [Nocardioides agariphilus]|uniref:AAA family ATPase n=1 Tax=Nocardioides agariphilus TaxID=433664 RepID=A0A930VLB1_9ACTN|nr:helix-turn-helix transcriptional regulator [Nocardioides agariphilus]MBF4768752.1 AAA family ATPase [Nocardioides agariphilus]